MEEPEPEPVAGGSRSRRVRWENSNSVSEPPVNGNGSSSVSVTPSVRLGEDELRLIFSSRRLSAKDLLSFRLVNKTWRDSATAALLQSQRDACYIALDMNPLAESPNATTKRLNSHFYKHGDRDTTSHKLSSLMILMSTSPQFPSSSFRIQTSKSVVSKYYDFPDLVMFCELHGAQINRLRPVGLVSQRYLLDVFFNYAPNLKCLDLSEARLGGSSGSDVATVAEWNSKTIPIQTLIIGNTGTVPGTGNQRSEILTRLLSSPSRLSSIWSVRPSTLPVVLDHGKGPLIKSFGYTIPGSVVDFEPFFPLIQQFTALNPKLVRLTLALHRMRPAPTFYADTVPFLNAIIESSKDTLQIFDLCVDPTELRTKLKIPPMKNLTEIGLSGTLRFHDDTQGPSLIQGDDGFVFGFDDGVLPGEYFPNLVKIRLGSPEWSISENLLCLKKLLSNNDGSRRDAKYCGKVDTLEIRHSSWSDLLANAKLIAELLPNISVLQISCKNLRDLNHSLWVMCPLVEFIEIKGLSTQGFFISTDRCLFFDNLFTGFSFDMCTKLEATEISESVDRPETFELLRIHPSVTDLKHLKEFKLKYSGRSQLVSRVTEKYVFAKMPSTKFNLLYYPNSFQSTIDPYEDQYEDEVFTYRQRQTARSGNGN